MGQLNSVGQEFKKDFPTTMKDWSDGFGHIIGDTFKGITGGGFDYNNVGVDFDNFGNDLHNTYKGYNIKQGRRHYSQSFAQQQASTWAKVLGEGGINENAPATGNSTTDYGSAVGNDNVKPSDLMKISDPTTKMTTSVTRGMTRTAMNVRAKMMDTSAVPALTGMNSGSASDNTNSAGGVGVKTSADMDNQTK